MSGFINKITTALVLSSTITFASDLLSPQDINDIKTLITLTPSAFKNPLEVTTYHLGKEQPYECTGFSEAERSHIWTDGVKATMVIPVLENDRKVTHIQFKNTSSLVTASRGQSLTVFIDDCKLSTYKYYQNIPNQTIDISIQNEFTNDAIISFKTPDAISPTDLGIGEDSRLLGIAFKEMVVSSRKVLTNEQKNKSSWVNLYCTNETEFWERIFSLQTKLEQKVIDPLNRGDQHILERDQQKIIFENVIHMYTNSVINTVPWLNTLEINPELTEEANNKRKKEKEFYMSPIKKKQDRLAEIYDEIEKEKPQYEQYKSLNDTFNSFIEALSVD